MRFTAVILLSCLNLFAAEDWGKKVSFTGTDGVVLSAVFAKPEAGKRTWILLHGLGSDKGEWRPFAKELKKRGMGYLALDLRGHSESVKAADGRTWDYQYFKTGGPGSQWFKMIDDVGLAVTFLGARGVAVADIVFCGASIGANIVINHLARSKASINPAVLFSPGLQYTGGLAAEQAMRVYQGPVAMVVGKGDAYSHQSVMALAKIKPAAKVFVKESGAHGAGLVDGKWEAAIIDWAATAKK
ncbi:MAG: alpha/beta fold hydrolase [Elusimicrobiota bacterium]